MNVRVIGMGHFASVVAVVVADRGHFVMQSDVLPHLHREGQDIFREPGYRELLLEMTTTGRLSDRNDEADIVWIAYDVPLDDNGSPVVTEVIRRIIDLDGRIPKTVPFIVSCQWPVGTTRKLEEVCQCRSFIYVIENVRAGRAIDDFRNQCKIIAGSRQRPSFDVESLFARLVDSPNNVIRISPESAELSKHALNAFMALQVAFINEIADVADIFKADPNDIYRVLVSDKRVSEYAPLRAGKPFGGGSLQRDLMVLEGLSSGPILHAIRASNDSRQKST